jgi:TetR/AcrR family transcriptional regulator
MPDQTSPNSPTSRAQRDGDTERRILDAARSVFVRRGTAGARMQEIAEEAGVNQALLHYYFRSKDGLAAAVFRDAAGRLLPSVIQVLGSDEPLEGKVERFVHLYIDTVRQSPFIPGYIVSELHHHPERMTELMAKVAGGAPSDIAQGFMRKLARQIDERVAAGTMRPIGPDQFLTNLLALTIFPFVARPLLSVLLGQDAEAFERFLDVRRAELPRYIFDALRP